MPIFTIACSIFKMYSAYCSPSIAPVRGSCGDCVNQRSRSWGVWYAHAGHLLLSQPCCPPARTRNQRMIHNLSHHYQQVHRAPIKVVLFDLSRPHPLVWAHKVASHASLGAPFALSWCLLPLLRFLNRQSNPPSNDELSSALHYI